MPPVSDVGRTPSLGQSLATGRGVGLKSDTGDPWYTGHSAAFAEARRLGHHWVGEEHALLALSREDGRAGLALDAAGATPEQLEAAIVDGLERADPPIERRATDTPKLTPAMHAAFGRAEGLAIARGEKPTPDDLLVALVWRAGSGSWLLFRLVAEPLVAAILEGKEPE